MENVNVVVIGMEGDSGKVIKLDEFYGLEKICLFIMLDLEKGLYFLFYDLFCFVNLMYYFFIFICVNNMWWNIMLESLYKWLEKMNKWICFYYCLLLVINFCNNSDK